MPEQPPLSTLELANDLSRSGYPRNLAAKFRQSSEYAWLLEYYSNLPDSELATRGLRSIRSEVRGALFEQYAFMCLARWYNNNPFNYLTSPEGASNEMVDIYTKMHRYRVYDFDDKYPTASVIRKYPDTNMYSPDGILHTYSYTRSGIGFCEYTLGFTDAYAERKSALLTSLIHESQQTEHEGWYDNYDTCELIFVLPRDADTTIPSGLESDLYAIRTVSIPVSSDMVGREATKLIKQAGIARTS